MSIGAVLTQLRDEFPDVTISKIRFLESEGLIRPARTETGYRKFTTGDVERLRFVLSVQRDQYLPLRVIRRQLDASDRGVEPASAGPFQSGDDLGPAESEVAPAEIVPLGEQGIGRTGPGRPEHGVALPGPQDFTSLSDEHLTKYELLEQADIDAALLAEIEQYALIRPRKAGGYDADDVTVARTVKAMTTYGIEPRHLRAFRASADREIGLLEQILAPVQRHGDDGARARAEEMSKELAALSVRLHTLLVRAGIRGSTSDE